MTNFILDMYSSGSIVEIFIAILLTLCILLLITVIVFLIYWCIDSWFRPTYEGEGITIGKDYTPAYNQTTMIFNAATKMMMPVITYYPEQWEVEVQVDNKTGIISVSQSFYETIEGGERLLVEYSTGRINSDNIYIKSISIL